MSDNEESMERLTADDLVDEIEAALDMNDPEEQFNQLYHRIRSGEFYLGPDSYGATPLMHAIFAEGGGVPDFIINALIDETSPRDLEYVDENGNTALIFLIDYGRSSDLMFRLLNTGHSNPGQVNDYRNTALLLLLGTNYFNEIQPYIHFIERLIGTGQSNPNQVGSNGHNALYYAQLHQLDNIVNLLLPITEVHEPAPEPIPRQNYVPQPLWTLTEIPPDNPVPQNNAVPQNNMPTVPQSDIEININDSGTNDITQETHVISDYLQQDNKNIVIRINGNNYLLNKKDLIRQAHEPNNKKYGCMSAGDGPEFIDNSNINLNIEYLSLSSVLGLQVLITMDEVLAMAISSNKLFVAEPTGTTLPSIMSVAYYNGTIGASADHCQPGKETMVYKISKATETDTPIAAPVAPAVAPVAQQDNTIKVQYSGATYKFPITSETTLNDVKNMLLNKLVEYKIINTTNYNVKLIYTGKVYKQDDAIYNFSKLLIDLADPPFGITLQAIVTPISGGRKSRRYKRGKLTNKKKYMKRRKTVKRKKRYTKRKN